MARVANTGPAGTQTGILAEGSIPRLPPIFGSDAAMFAKRGAAKKSVTVEYNLPKSITAPVKAGEQVGTAQVIADGKPVESVVLIAPADVPRKTGVLQRIFGKL